MKILAYPLLSKFTQLSQASVESGYEVVRSLRFKVLRTIQNVNKTGW